VSQEELDAGYERLMADMAAATPEQRAEWARDADRAEAEHALRAARDGEKEAWLAIARHPGTDRYVCDYCSKDCEHDEVEPVEGEPWKVICRSCTRAGKRPRRLAP